MNHSILAAEAKEVLMQLVACIQQLSHDEYTYKMPILSYASIGEHTRHIIELFEQLINDYDSAIIHYSHRKRDVRIQEDIDFATEKIAIIIQNLSKDNKQLRIAKDDHQCIHIDSNYHRELLYNIEHCIHHQAIIKIALMKLEDKHINENFGVASSTIVYRQKNCQS